MQGELLILSGIMLKDIEQPVYSQVDTSIIVGCAGLEPATLTLST